LARAPFRAGGLLEEVPHFIAAEHGARSRPDVVKLALRRLGAQ